MLDIIEDKPGKKILLMGNEAIVRGALEAGVDVATTYPGTPSSEIADTFSHIAKTLKKEGKDPDFYMQYSVNEKVSLEVAGTAALCGLRALTCMKHVGLNVASDAFMTYTYVGCRGGHIIISADDPACHSSQNEQDNRYYALFGGAPMLEPSTPEEAKEMTRVGFGISEELEIPLLLRTTTRLNHARGPVEMQKIEKSKRKGHFIKDPMLVTTPAVARVKHPLLLEKLSKAEALAEVSKFNFIVRIGKSKDLGIVCSGVSYNYVREVIEDMNVGADVLKLGMTNPLPKKMCTEFIKEHKTIIMVEEGEPFLETQFKTMAFDASADVKIYGKDSGHFTRLYEYNPDIVATAFSEILGMKNPIPTPIVAKTHIPSRPPTLCPGCPHRSTYYAVKKAAPKDTVYPTDIGCYTLGRVKPYETADILFCMGSNGGAACGLSISTDQKIISFMGDSTFFHSGIPPIVNAVHHNHDCVITVLDNRTTAMTGHQPHPGTEFDGMGNPARMIAVEDVVRGCGVECVEVVDPSDIEATKEAFKRALAFKGPAVVVTKSPCILLEVQRLRREGKCPKTYTINQEKCTKCKVCIKKFACPAFYTDEKGNIQIDETLCNGCGVCMQVCKFGAIGLKEEK